ncbi:class I adenylate-forming enzyme family protein [Halobellus litoreus]|uniref:Class I adenylate-forming enzyme family protein n=1 Tax=Halobellus litoreus TaxID=755310 RepID=A0ABD6DSN8_9EURY|nr:class I adenylate-forming enzyme family protein [Halobellus litoreus]
MTTTANQHVDLPSLVDVCRQNADRSPDAPAFDDGDRSVTWGEFDRETDRAADSFLDYVSRGDRVAFLCESSVTQTVLLFGAMKAGCVVTNVHLKSASDVMKRSVAETRPAVVVVDEHVADRVRSELDEDAMRSVSTVVVVGDDADEGEQTHGSFLEGAAARSPDVLINEEDLATIWWTSGSTGRPKGWCHTHRGMYLKAMKGAARYGVDRSGRTLVVFSPSFGAWYNPVVKAMMGCESVRFLRGWDAAEFVDIVEREDITHTGLVATMWREVLQRGVADRDFSSLEVVYSTGEKMDSGTLDRLRDHVCRNVTQSYGSTEMYGTVLYNEEMTGDRIDSVGKAQTGTEVRIVEEGGAPDDVREPGALGEIIIRGPDVPAWAWRNTAKTTDGFRDGWWYSGDLGYRDEGGYLYLEGRVDNQIKSRGVKIIPERVEEALNDHPDVTRSAVVGVDDEEYGQRVTAIVVPAAESLTSEELDEWCLESDLVADHERPRAYHFVDELEKTSSGKLDRNAVKERLGL